MYTFNRPQLVIYISLPGWIARMPWGSRCICNSDIYSERFWKGLDRRVSQNEGSIPICIEETKPLQDSDFCHARVCLRTTSFCYGAFWARGKNRPSLSQPRSVFLYHGDYLFVCTNRPPSSEMVPVAKQLWSWLLQILV